MKEIYRKRGRAVRWENGTIVRVSESGVAVESDELFTCHPDPGLAGADAAPGGGPGIPEAEPLEDLSGLAGRVGAVARAIRVPEGVRIERLIVSEGHAEHTYRDRAWSETTTRIHLALTRSGRRVLVDLADFEIDCIAPIAEALARCEEREREPPAVLRLAPNVVAALLPSMPGLAQREGGIDGKGNPIGEATEPWPNWYRPSYRSRPVRAPFNLMAKSDVTEIDESLPHGIALAGPSRLLIVDGDRVYSSTARIPQFEAVSAPVRWYPYAAGAWGANAVARPA